MPMRNGWRPTGRRPRLKPATTASLRFSRSSIVGEGLRLRSPAAASGNRFTGRPGYGDPDHDRRLVVHGLDELTGGRGTSSIAPSKRLQERAVDAAPHAHRTGAAGNRRAQPRGGVRLPQNEGTGDPDPLDDFQLSKKMDVLSALADYVKVDFRLTDSDERRAIVRRVEASRRSPSRRKFETRKNSTLRWRSFRLFQGYLGHPCSLSKRRSFPLDANHLRDMRVPHLDRRRTQLTGRYPE